MAWRPGFWAVRRLGSGSMGETSMAWGEYRGWGGTRPAVAAGEEVFILTLWISGTVRFTPVSAVFKMGD